MPSSKDFPVLSPDLQIDFYFKLKSIRTLHLGDALRRVVGESSIETIDKELSVYVPAGMLARVAKHSLRGEVIYPIPFLINAEPRLLGYYRLLLGFSQKEFYGASAFSGFKPLEERGVVSDKQAAHIPALCRSLIASACTLVGAIDVISPSILHELQLLTLGPQLRGAANTKVGKDATDQVFELLKSLLASYIVSSDRQSIRIRNESKRFVTIAFASDPDMWITEELANSVRPLASIEIKGGSDFSNVYNRLGEAEKSHLKAKKKGCFEFWTILRSHFDEDKAKIASPTTSHFFVLDEIRKSGSPHNILFRELLGSLLGISDIT